jgi:uncharacterized membrane protein
MAKPGPLRHDLRETNEPGVLLRRALIGTSLLGIASMAIVTLYQTGAVRHLPHPPLKGFDSDKVNASDTAFGWGMPDAPLSIVSHAVNIALATVGKADRAEEQPWVPVMASATAAPSALVSAKYVFYQMPVKERGWCPYCSVDGLSHMAAFGFTLWEERARRRVVSPQVSGGLPSRFGCAARARHASRCGLALIRELLFAARCPQRKATSCARPAAPWWA